MNVDQIQPGDMVEFDVGQIVEHLPIFGGPENRTGHVVVLSTANRPTNGNTTYMVRALDHSWGGIVWGINLWVVKQETLSAHDRARAAAITTNGYKRSGEQP